MITAKYQHLESKSRQLNGVKLEKGTNSWISVSEWLIWVTIFECLKHMIVHEKSFLCLFSYKYVVMCPPIKKCLLTNRMRYPHYKTEKKNSCFSRDYLVLIIEKVNQLFSDPAHQTTCLLNFYIWDCIERYFSYSLILFTDKAKPVVTFCTAVTHSIQTILELVQDRLN